MTETKLTAKQQIFVEEYLIDLNATRAAKEAGYSEKTARSQGQRLLTNVDIQKATQEAMDERSERTEITQDKVISDIEIIRVLAIKEKQYSVAVKCSELQGKHLRLFTDKTDVNFTGKKSVEHTWTIQGVAPSPRKDP